ncbi:cingulin-like protein 1 [Corythoichthys intestinalis]|uniref:cingulin-like protein 1 n=1 Tax=Corythoichthys intestinalis TaxID=161448 RepID=UPI0025A67EFF|nr:cingulin-like protein 1 [Corythoichthys intestinalis]XP_057689131.1 cingulin-like protein 1 [Corythoichthys intestinalis]XP_061796277.1 cingulin-like protein 1 [Nerophis lumbriciformis]
MESYRVTGIPTSGPQRAYTQTSRPSRPHSIGGGTYGLSIRVQGIDGHPYVVLNNQDKGPQSFIDPNSNGYIETESSFIDNYHEYDFRGDKEGAPKSPFGEYRSQKMMQYAASQNDSTDSKEKKAQTLLNFQKHPEILQPYDPETNSLNFHSLPSKPLSLPERDTRSTSTVSVPSSNRSSSLDRNKATSQSHKSQLLSTSPNDVSYKKMKLPHQSLGPAHNSQLQTKSQVAQPQSKSRLNNQSQPQSKPTTGSHTQESSASSPTSERIKTQNKFPNSVSSSNSSLDRKAGKPDVLLLRRSDSSGPVLQSSSRSRHASSPSTPKMYTDENLDSLYADTINRHENRRYIPFVPGSGRDIDTGSIPGVDELIERFDNKDGSHHRRGRTGRRNRINLEDRKRSHSVDSAFGRVEGFSSLNESSRLRGTSMEHVLRPSQLRLHRAAGNQDPWFMVNSKPPSRTTSAPGSPQTTLSKGAGYIQGYQKMQSHSTFVALKSKDTVDIGSSAGKLSTTLSKSTIADKKSTTDTDVQATPDLLKGQQELSQQTNEETAKQILFNYLKDGSADNDETTKRKVNLVFEKIQTLKSRATAGPPDDKSMGLSSQSKVLQEQNAALEKKMAEMKQQLQELRTTNKSDGMAASGLKELQRELDKSSEECKRLKEKVAKTEGELQTTLEELFQVKMEREQYQTEIRDLQDQLSEMHDELDTAKTSAADGERDAIMADIMQLKVELQQVLLAKEEQEDVLRRRERELTALKGALKEEVAAHDQEIDKMKDKYEKEMSRLQSSLAEAKQSSTAVVQEKVEAEAAKGVLEGQASRLSQEAERLRKRVQELENEVAKLNRIIDDAKLQEIRLGERVARMEKEKKQLEESLSEIKEQEEEMSRANRALTLRLEDVQRNFSKLSSEHTNLEERLQEEKDQKEQFKNMKNDIEDERRLLDRTVEKLQKEMNDIVDASQLSTRELQEQIDIYKEKNRRELTELEKLLKERGQELDKYLLVAQTLQEELSSREEDLRRSERERDEAVLREKIMEEKLHELEASLQTYTQTKDDRARQFKLMEDRIAQLELDLDEERQNGDQLMDRLDRGREQVDQMRSELMQERAGRQDAECDKMALERQSKDLKNKLADLEGSQKSSKGDQVAQLEDRIRELEERLEGEERERANLQLSNRRLERKVKEVMMQVEEEHHSMQDQKDQLNLRLKALKRQMDEAEEEIDRLEHGKKKLQRDLDEQQETNEQLQSQLKTLRSEMRRKSTSAPLLNNLDDDDDDDDVSTDGETYFSSTSSYKRSSSQDNLLSTFSL